MRYTVVTHKSAHGISVVTIIVTLTKAKGKTSSRPENGLSARYNLNGMHSRICTYIGRYYHSAMSRHVQTFELVL